MGLQLDLWTVDGATFVTKLPKVANVASMDEFNDDGQLTFTVARSSMGADKLLASTEGMLQLSLDGEPVAWGVLDKDGDDPTSDEASARDVTVTAPGTAVLFEDAIILPAADAPSTQRTFNAVTPGAVMLPIISEAQTRGALLGVSCSFTATHDSSGLPWPTPYTRQYEAGATVRDALQSLADFRLVDFRMRRLVLDLYVADTTLNRDLGDVILQPQWFTEAPRERGRQGKVTHLFAVGDNNLSTTAVSAEPGRRRESFAQIGGVGDAATLQIAADATLAPLAKVAEGYTVTYNLTKTGTRPRPWSDYRVGDSIRRGDVRNAAGELDKLRVRSVSVALAESGASAITLELNDVFLESEIRNQLLLDKLVNGTTVVGSPVYDYGSDRTPPAAPTVVTVTSDAYATGPTTYAANLIASWPAVVTNYDGTPTGDVAGYEVQYNINGAGFGTAISRTPGQAIARDSLPLKPATAQVRVRAVDRTNNYSTWRNSATVTLAAAPDPD